MRNKRHWLFLVTLTAFIALDVLGGFHSHVSSLNESQCNVCQALHVSVSDVPLHINSAAIVFEESSLVLKAAPVFSRASHATLRSRSPPAL